MPIPVVRVTKQMLGNTTRKSLLYLDQGFWSLAFREKRTSWVDEAMGGVFRDFADMSPGERVLF